MYKNKESRRLESKQKIYFCAIAGSFVGVFGGIDELVSQSSMKALILIDKKSDDYLQIQQSQFRGQSGLKDCVPTSSSFYTARIVPRNNFEKRKKASLKP